MKKKILILLSLFFLIPYITKGQANRFNRPFTTTYTPLTPSEILAPGMIMRQRHDAMFQNINDMIKYINGLKAQTNETIFITAMNTNLTKLKNISRVLEERGVNAVNVNSLSQIYNDVQNEINNYNVRIERQNHNQNQLTNYIGAANEAMNNHRYSVAIEYLTKAINLVPNNPDNKDYYKTRGLCYLYGVNNPESAKYDLIRYSQQCEPYSVSQAEAFFLIGHTYTKTNQLQTAVDYYSKCINIDNSYLDAYFSRGLAKSGLNDRLGAIADYDYIISYTGAAKQRFKDMATVYNNKSYCLVELGEYDKALPVVEKALEMDNTIAYIWDTRGEIFYHKKSYSKSISDMNKAIELSIQGNYIPANSYFYRGLAKIQLSQRTDGCVDLSKASELGYHNADESIAKYCK